MTPGIILSSARGGIDNPHIFATAYQRSSDTDISWTTHLSGNSGVGFLPYSIPPRSRVTVARLGGGTTPTSGSTGRVQVQAYASNDVDFQPTTKIGDVVAAILAGAGSIVDTSGPPWVGFQVGANWFASFDMTDADLLNESFHDPLNFYLGVQLQGGGAFTAGTFYSAVRNSMAPSFLKIAADQAWQYAFVDNPTIGGQASGDVEARPLIQLFLESL